MDWTSFIEEVFTLMQKHNEISSFSIPKEVKADWAANLIKWQIDTRIEAVPVIKAFIIGFYWGARR